MTRFRFLSLALVAGLLLGAQTATAKEISLDELQGFIDAGWQKWQSVKDYTCTFVKQERVKGKLLDKETILFKHRVKPHSVYMKWIKDPHEGRESLYVQGKNDNEIKVHEGGLLGAVNVNLDPRGSMVMKENRHTVFDAGIGNVIKLIRNDFEKAKADGDGKFEDLGMVVKEGANLRCFRATFPVDKAKTGYDPVKGTYYSSNIVICIDGRTTLPAAIEHRDAKGQLEEFYLYKDCRLNPGLTDKDFDPDNDDYRF